MKHDAPRPENSSEGRPTARPDRRGRVLAAVGALSGPAAAQARKGEIVAGLSERMLTLDPANHYSISATSVLRHIYDPLVEVTNDSKFVPCLAESWTPVNNTTWRFNLRKGVKFHDGTPVHRGQRHLLAQARPRDNTKLIKSFVYQDIEDVEKDGDFTVIVSTKKPVRLAAGSPHDAGDAAARRPPRTRRRSSRSRSGPARSSSVAGPTASRSILNANADYWKPGIPKVEKVTLPVHPGALDPRGRDAGRRAPRHRSRVAGQRADAPVDPRRPGPRHAGHRGAAVDLPARQGAGQGSPRSARPSRSPSTGTSSSRTSCSGTRARWTVPFRPASSATRTSARRPTIPRRPARS